MSGAQKMPPPCDREVYEHGEHVLTTHGPAWQTEHWVRGLARRTGQRVDWCYFGGRVVVLALGDVDRVRAELKAQGYEPIPARFDATQPT